VQEQLFGHLSFSAAGAERPHWSPADGLKRGTTDSLPGPLLTMPSARCHQARAAAGMAHVFTHSAVRTEESCIAALERRESWMEDSSQSQTIMLDQVNSMDCQANADVRARAQLLVRVEGLTG